MARVNWRDRIVSDPEILGGESCIKGTRIPITVVIDNLANGVTSSELIDDFPSLTREDIIAILEFASELIHAEVESALRDIEK